MRYSTSFSIAVVLLSLLHIEAVLHAQPSALEFPPVWMSYYGGMNLEKDFADMKAHGVDAIETGIWGIEGNSRAKDILKVARKNDVKVIIGVPEVAEQAYFFEDEVERAVMMGGAYQGKAIDRFRFSFERRPHSISIESPVYDKVNCYGEIGRYFMGLQPVGAEVVVKKADFDGQQHLEIIPAVIKPEKEHFWTMSFDLSEAKGDLDNVVLAVYWISKGTRRHWIFGDAVSMHSPGFHSRLSSVVNSVLQGWKAANGGEFPSEVVAMRYGDECFHVSGHLNSPECSFPMWDFSESSVKAFKKIYNGEFPRGVGWTDMFGHEAYAKWLYTFHLGAANSVATVKSVLTENGLEHIPVFRNMTRMGVFDVVNDWDGTGIDLLSQEFDILHLDPYPINTKGYDERIIPRDMSYVEGFSRRYNKALVPWMQAHVYGGHEHPGPKDIGRMVEQQMKFGNDAIMWLGYGGGQSGNTFPNARKKSWKQAAIAHEIFKAAETPHRKADIAVVRPYTLRSLMGAGTESADYYLTRVLVENTLVAKGIPYDSFEPLDWGGADVKELNSYKTVLAEIGSISVANMNVVDGYKGDLVLILQGAAYEPAALHRLGIESVNNDSQSYGLIDKEVSFSLSGNAELIAGSRENPRIWKSGSIIVIGHLPDSGEGMGIPEELISVCTGKKE